MAEPDKRPVTLGRTSRLKPRQTDALAIFPNRLELIAKR